MVNAYRAALRRPSLRRIAVALAALVATLLLAATALLTLAPRDPAAAAAQLDEALRRMESVSARMQMDAASATGGGDPPGGQLRTSLRASGEIVPPDRLHLVVHEGNVNLRQLVIVGERMWIDEGGGYRAVVRSAPLGPLGSPQAPLRFVRGPGQPLYVGLGLSRGAPTYRIRIELDSAALRARVGPGQPVDAESGGAIEVEIGVLDGLVRRQSFDVDEPAGQLGTLGVQRLRTTYTIEYWDHGRALEVREPD